MKATIKKKGNCNKKENTFEFTLKLSFGKKFKKVKFLQNIMKQLSQRSNSYIKPKKVLLPFIPCRLPKTSCQVSIENRSQATPRKKTATFSIGISNNTNLNKYIRPGSSTSSDTYVNTSDVLKSRRYFDKIWNFLLLNLFLKEPHDVSHNTITYCFSVNKKKHLFTLWHWTPKIEFMEK